MSEEATAVAAPEAVEAAPAPPPVVEEAAPAVPEAPSEPPKVAPTREAPPLPPRSVRQMAKTSAMEKAAKAAAEFAEATRTPGKVDERGRVHATEDGTYMEEGAATEVAPEAPEAPEEGAAQVAPEEVEGAAAEVAEPVTGETPPAAQVAGSEFVTIALDPNGPLADQGVSELTVPAALERHIRTLVNASVRQRDVQDTKSALEQAHLDNARLQARVQALSEGRTEADPLEAEMLAQIKEHYPDKLAEIEAALAVKRESETSQKEAEIYAEIQREHISKVFMHDVFTTSPQKYPVWSTAGELQNRMADAMAQYGDYVDARNLNLARTGQPPTEPTSSEFYGWVDTQYIRDPRVQDQVKQFRSAQQEKSRADIAAQERQKLAQQEKATLAAAAERHSARPPSTPGIPSQGTTPLPAEEGAGRTHGNRAKALKQGIRERYSSTA